MSPSARRWLFASLCWRRCQKKPITSVMAGSLFIAALVACAPQQQQGTASTATPPPAQKNWHQITAPTKENIPNYAISLDVPGLIVACIGASSDEPSGTVFEPAHLWRSRDDGAHWQQLSSPIPLKAGCTVTMYTAGKGALAVYDDEGGTLMVSPDAGDTWKTGTQLLDHEIIPNRFTSLQEAVYRDGRLYTSLILNTAISRVFSVSDDYGLTWTVLQETPDAAPGDLPLLTENFTPDYQATGAWFRYSLHAHNDFSLPHYYSVDHSSDNGRTWQPITKIDANGAEIPEYGRSLVSRPEQPAVLCEGLLTFVSVPGIRIPFADLTLGRSEDSGKTWRYIRVTQTDKNHRYQSDWNVQMDAQGNCYTTISPFNVGTNNQQPTGATILRWSPGMNTSPVVIASITLQTIQGFGIFALRSGNGLHIVIIAATIDPPVNQTIHDGIPQLLWEDVTT